MANYDTLRTALELLWARDVESVTTEEFKPENLSSQEKTLLQEQLQSSGAWQLGSDQNVIGLGIADKRQGGGKSGELALTVYVNKKYAADRLDSAQLVPAYLDLEGLGEPVPTDVREIGRIRLELEALSARVRPIVCGYSIGRVTKGSTGTLGCMVTDRSGDGKPLLLSNSHVLAKSGSGQPGDPIYQPGPDDADISQPVAELFAWRPFKFGDAVDNRVDAAVAEPIDQDLFNPEIYDIGRPQGMRLAKRGMMVQKSGRTTGHTWGQIDSVDFVTSIPYPKPTGGGYEIVRFRDLILCSRYTQSGDSGALVLDAEGYAVGLHFCGTPVISVASPIQYVLDELNVDLVL